MKQQVFLSLIVVIMIAALAAPSLTAAGVNGTGDVTITLEFQWIRQGQVGIVRARGEDVAEVRAVFQERVHYFYPDERGFVGLIAADMDSDVGFYTMQVWVKYADGTAETIDQEIEVNSGEFGRSDVTLTASMLPLMEAEVEEAEINKLFNIMNRVTPERYWVGGFVPPEAERVIGYFGTWRLYNDTYWRRHTGVDYRMAIGTPVKAAASGRVMLSEMLDIRGGYVLIDHGWGVYSGYAHLSERLVVPGEWVRQGDVIALSGLNGRSQGAHLHWEMVVGGAWIHPEVFAGLGLDVEATLPAEAVVG